MLRICCGFLLMYLALLDLLLFLRFGSAVAETLPGFDRLFGATNVL